MPETAGPELRSVGHQAQLFRKAKLPRACHERASDNLLMADGIALLAFGIASCLDMTASRFARMRRRGVVLAR